MKKPKFDMGQQVTYTLRATGPGKIQLVQDHVFYISGITMSSDAHGQTFEYTIAASLPDAYYNGSGFIDHISEKDLS